jgi:hypothetical protein
MTRVDGGSSSMHNSGMFSGSQHFTVTGKTLTNVTNNYTTARGLPSREFYNATWKDMLLIA